MTGDPASDVPPDEAGGRLTIDLGALAQNWRLLADRAAGAECAAAIKADAYGIGIERAAPALWDAGCRTVFVAHVAEARRVRAILRDATIYVLNGFLPGTGAAYLAQDLRPVLGSREEIAEWAALAHGEGRSLPAAWHVDTGMNRLGLTVPEARAIAAEPFTAPALLMSHLVSAEVPDDPVNERQIADFATVRAAYPGVPASLANSAGLFLGARPFFDLVRPGFALYGGNPTPGRRNPMREVVRLEGRIIQVRTVEAGETVGYNGRWSAGGRRRIATLSVGYADGLPRAASGTDGKTEDGQPAGEAIVGGRRCPFAGNVSMDLIAIDVTDAPAEAVHRGAPAVLIGDGLGVDEVGRRAGTMGYEILTGLGHRYARRYRET